jgi:hypothetical protein
MDATVQLALMAKANQIFPATGQFLSFPALSPLTYLPAQLRFATGRLERQDWLDYSEFSRVVNHIPRGPLYDLSDDSYLWDVYGGVLDSADLPGQPPAAADDAEYQRAIAYLYVTSPEGLRSPSEAARKYGWYRDAVLVAEQDYAGKQVTAQNTDDPEIKERWETLESPVLRRQIDMLKADWETQGFRKEVEAARVVERRSAALHYSATWTRWQDQYNPDLDKPTDILLNRFAGTSFSPADIAQRGDWQTITLEGGEIETLAAGADPELRRVLSANTQRSDIARLSFDARSVGLDRPWFVKELLSSRFWRLPDSQRALSDGADLSKGTCPAYVAGLVFARNVEVTRKVAGQDQPFKARLSSQYLFNLTAAPQVMMAVPMQAMPATPAPAAAPRAIVRDHRKPAMRAAAGKPAVRMAAGVRATEFRTADFNAAATRNFDVRVTMPTTVLTGPPAPTPTPTSPPPVPDAADDSITILALICRQVPKSPDPDPTLPWTN